MRLHQTESRSTSVCPQFARAGGWLTHHPEVDLVLGAVAVVVVRAVVVGHGAEPVCAFRRVRPLEAAEPELARTVRSSNVEIRESAANTPTHRTYGRAVWKNRFFFSVAVV